MKKDRNRRNKKVIKAGGWIEEAGEEWGRVWGEENEKDEKEKNDDKKEDQQDLEHEKKSSRIIRKMNRRTGEEGKTIRKC